MATLGYKGTNGRNNLGDVKGKTAEVTVLDKGDRKAYLKAKHLGRLRNQQFLFLDKENKIKHS
jgi:hypothetical protein